MTSEFLVGMLSGTAFGLILGLWLIPVSVDAWTWLLRSRGRHGQ